jgi:protein phosphatase
MVAAATLANDPDRPWPDSAMRISGATNTEMSDDRRFSVQAGRLATGGTRIGPRHSENEDSLRIAEPDSPDVVASHGKLYIVADGVGGHAKGEVASSLAVEEVERVYYGTNRGNAVGNLVFAISEANLRVHETASVDESEGLSMATTVVAAAVLDDQIVVANVGDSRAYVVGGGSIRQLSRDHSWVQEEVESGRLTPEEARRNPRRNIITRALGLTNQVLTEIKTETDTAAHARLVLCTDGVHGVLDDDELRGIVESLPPREAVQRVLELVDERKGRDDATLIVAELGGHVSEEPEPQNLEGHEHRDNAAFIPRVFRLFRRR